MSPTGLQPRGQMGMTTVVGAFDRPQQARQIPPALAEQLVHQLYMLPRG
jgi:hypothetical protein